MAATRTRTKKPITRTCRLEGNILGIQVGHAAFVYHIEPIASDFGIAVLLRKQEAVRDELGFIDGFEENEVYAVNLGTSARDTHCGCLGFMHHGHCKHVESLQALQDAGKLLPVLDSLRVEKGRQEATQHAQQWRQLATKFPALAQRLLAVEGA